MNVESNSNNKLRNHKRDCTAGIKRTGVKIGSFHWFFLGNLQEIPLETGKFQIPDCILMKKAE